MLSENVGFGVRKWVLRSKSERRHCMFLKCLLWVVLFERKIAWKFSSKVRKCKTKNHTKKQLNSVKLKKTCTLAVTSSVVTIRNTGDIFFSSLDHLKVTLTIYQPKLCCSKYMRFIKFHRMSSLSIPHHYYHSEKQMKV